MNIKSIFILVTIQIWSLTSSTAFAGSTDFRYVDESTRLPLDTNPPETDTLDVDFADVDKDGDLDIYIAEGTASPEPRANKLTLTREMEFSQTNRRQGSRTAYPRTALKLILPMQTMTGIWMPLLPI